MSIKTRLPKILLVASSVTAGVVTTEVYEKNKYFGSEFQHFEVAVPETDYAPVGASRGKYVGGNDTDQYHDKYQKLISDFARTTVLNDSKKLMQGDSEFTHDKSFQNVDQSYVVDYDQQLAKLQHLKP